MRKKRRGTSQPPSPSCIAQPCLTFLRNSTPASITTDSSPTVFSPSLRADIMLTSPPTFDISSRSSLSLIYEFYSPSFSLSRFLLRRHLLTPTRLEAASPGTKHPRPVRMLQTRHSPEGARGASGRATKTERDFVLSGVNYRLRNRYRPITFSYPDYNPPACRMNGILDESS